MDSSQAQDLVDTAHWGLTLVGYGLGAIFLALLVMVYQNAKDRPWWFVIVVGLFLVGSSQSADAMHCLVGVKNTQPTPYNGIPIIGGGAGDTSAQHYVLAQFQPGVVNLLYSGGGLWSGALTTSYDGFAGQYTSVSSVQVQRQNDDSLKITASVVWSMPSNGSRIAEFEFAGPLYNNSAVLQTTLLAIGSIPNDQGWNYAGFIDMHTANPAGYVGIQLTVTLDSSDWEPPDAGSSATQPSTSQPSVADPGQPTQSVTSPFSFGAMTVGTPRDMSKGLEWNIGLGGPSVDARIDYFGQHPYSWAAGFWSGLEPYRIVFRLVELAIAAGTFIWQMVELFVHF